LNPAIRSRVKLTGNSDLSRLRARRYPAASATALAKAS